MDSNPIHHPSPAKKNEMLVFRLRSLLMICLADWWTWTPSATPLQPIKWNASFWIVFTSDDQPGWLMDSNAIHHPSLPKKMKSSFLYYIKLLMISRAGLLEPHLPALSSQKNEMLIFVLQSTSDLGQTGQWTRTPSTTHLQPIKWNAHFWIMLNFWWLAGLVDGLKPHPPPPFTQKNEMLIFGLCSTSDIGWAARLTWTPSTTPLQPKTWNACFCITFNIWCWPDWSMDSNPICHPL